MKIAIIGQKGIPSRAGGVEIHVEEIATRLVNKNHDITVYCRENYCDNKYDIYRKIKIKYIKSINSKHLDAITYSFLATIDALKNNYDIIQYHALGPSLLTFFPRIFGKKVVCTCHGLDWQREKWGKVAKIMLKMGEYSAIKFSNRMIVVSEGLVDYYKEKYNREVLYIPNGVDNKKRVTPNEIKSMFNLEENGYILFLARLVPEKGVHYLIDAFNKLDTDKKLVIAGGSSHSDTYVNEIKKRAKDNKNIIFTGFVKGKLLEELFTNAYFYVLPSEIEGLPISLLEAMAYGQCCLVSDIKQNRDVVEQYAELFISKDSTDLNKKMKYLLENEAVVKQYKKNSKKFILNKYNWDEVARKTEKVFEKVIN